jgi:DNA polymerase III delta subunit
MIRFFIGDDTQKSRTAARTLFEKLRFEDSSATTGYFDDLLFDITLATEAFTAENLFGGGTILYFDGILEHSDGERFYKSILKETGHNVIVREMAPSKDLRAFFGRLGEVKEFTQAKVFERRVDSFAVANALGARDKKASWVEFEKVRKSGAAMEEVHGTIFWAFKTMLISSVLNKQEALRSGVKETSYRTYHAHSKNYSADEIRNKLAVLKDIYHKGHKGEGDMDELLEEFILHN